MLDSHHLVFALPVRLLINVKCTQSYINAYCLAIYRLMVKLLILAAFLFATGLSSIAYSQSPSVAALTLSVNVTASDPSGLPPRKWLYGPLYGISNATGDEVLAQLSNLASYNIPITAYDFDAWGWSLWPTVPCGWGLGQPVLDQLQQNGLLAILHFWGGCRTDSQFNTALTDLGSGILGAFYLDSGASDATTIGTVQWVQANLPDTGAVVMKLYNTDCTSYPGYGDPNVPDGCTSDDTIGQYGNIAYVSDLPTDFSGLIAGIQRVLTESTLIPAPYNEFTGYDGNPTCLTEETYLRRLHFGAMQVIMHHVQEIECDPWDSIYSSDPTAPGIDLVERYRFWAWFHRELVPYLYSYEWQANETGNPIFINPDITNLSTQLGNELFAAYVTTPSVSTVDIVLPAGDWINLWDMTQVFHGPGPVTLPAPLGHEPTLIRSGGLVPLDVSQSYVGHGTPESAGSLTVLVVPNGNSTFQYRDAADNTWATLSASANGSALTLSSDPLSTDVIWRVELWPNVPCLVSVSGSTISVNHSGTPIAESVSEAAVNGSTGPAWFYDATAQRLIVKAPR